MNRSIRIGGEARLHPVRTPEGITLPFRIGLAGDRIKAFLIDLLIISAATIAVWIVAVLAYPTGAGTLAAGLALLASFLLRNFYFIFWEVNHGGVTIGKRAAGLRVISRDGGPLTAEAVFARNLTRDVEVFLPLTVLLAPQAVANGLPAWAGLLSGAWLLVFAALPLCNKDRLRCGDLIAGTLVVQAPVPVLLRDLTAPAEPASAFARRQEPPKAPAYTFTREQLDIYGIHELQVLEDILRRFDQSTLEPGTLEDVSERIKKKIRWPADQWRVPPLDFLQAFYAAQRGRLEQKLLFGQRQERKKG
jgi:uncharacterized RDD family membrane protein YckC